MARREEPAEVEEAQVTTPPEPLPRLENNRTTSLIASSRAPLINLSAPPNELNAMLMHSVNHADACSAYFNKIRGIPEPGVGDPVGEGIAQRRASALLVQLALRHFWPPSMSSSLI
jgi:hypothetical protein